MFELQIAIIIHSFSPPQNCGHVFLANCGKRSTRISRSPITPPWPKRSESTIQATRRYQHHNKPLTHLQVYSQRRFNAVVGEAGFRLVNKVVPAEGSVVAPKKPGAKKGEKKRSTPASSKKRKVEEATEDNAGGDWVVVGGRVPLTQSHQRRMPGISER
jgi:hypothetical protein